MIANTITFSKGYWHLNASIFCDMYDFRRPGGGSECEWEQRDTQGVWEPTEWDGYCEDLLLAYFRNGGVIK